MASIILLLFLVTYVFAIMGVRMFREILPSKVCGTNPPCEIRITRTVCILRGGVPIYTHPSL